MSIFSVEKAMCFIESSNTIVSADQAWCVGRFHHVHLSFHASQSGVPSEFADMAGDLDIYSTRTLERPRPLRCQTVSPPSISVSAFSEPAELLPLWSKV